jgi:hypothetical protein
MVIVEDSFDICSDCPAACHSLGSEFRAGLSSKCGYLNHRDLLPATESKCFSHVIRRLAWNTDQNACHRFNSGLAGPLKGIPRLLNVRAFPQIVHSVLIGSLETKSDGTTAGLSHPSQELRVDSVNPGLAFPFNGQIPLQDPVADGDHPGSIEGEIIVINADVPKALVNELL